jgi:hypothetical protein
VTQNQTTTDNAEKRYVTPPSSEIRWSPTAKRAYMRIRDRYYRVTVDPFAEDLPADAERLVPETVLAAKDAEIQQLREYAETTRHHQQRHADAVREIEQVRTIVGTPGGQPLTAWARAFAAERNELREETTAAPIVTELTEAVATALMTADRDEAGLHDEVERDAQTVAEHLIDDGWINQARRAQAETWCICGSMRFFDDMLTVAKDETVGGRIVHMPYSVIAPDNQGSDLKAMLDRLHRQKIDASVGIIVVTRGGYIGHSTRGEIEYAEATGKAVRYMHLPAAGESGDKPGEARWPISTLTGQPCNHAPDMRCIECVEENGFRPAPHEAQA